MNTAACERSATVPAPAPSVASATTVPRRLKGKIAALTKEQRDAINRLLLDGASYPVIVERAAERGIDLNTENVSNWFQTGFQDFLAQQERLDYQRARYDAAIDLLKETDTSRLPQAGLQTAAAQMYDLLGHFTPATLGQNLADEPEKYTRIVNALSRLAREALAIQKYQDACAKARVALEPMKDPHRKLTESEARAIVEKVDELLGLNIEPRNPYEFDPRKRTPDGRLLTELSPEERKKYTDDGRLNTEPPTQGTGNAEGSTH